MLEFTGGWLSLFRDPAIQPSQRPAARKPPGPDYAALVEALANDIGPPDGAGELFLTPEQAARVRRAGWSARPGCWRCPAIPWEFVALYPWLWHLREMPSESRSMSW